MNTIREIEDRRAQILSQMQALRSMCKGTLAKQMLKVKHKGKDQPVLRGPYYVLVQKAGGKTQSKRLTTPEQIRRAEQDVANHKRFVELCTEFARLTQQLGEAERQQGLEQEALKKGLKSPSNRTPK